jgi:hypothetical protein
MRHTISSTVNFYNAGVVTQRRRIDIGILQYSKGGYFSSSHISSRKIYRKTNLAPILSNTVFPILHIFVRFSHRSV